MIAPAGGEVLSMPLGLGLKAGSWQAVMADYPGLESLAVHRRFDDQPVRFLLPDTIRLVSNGERLPATHLVFPGYRSGTRGKLEPLSILQALRALTGSGYQVPELDTQRVECILRWIAELNCSALTYSSTTEALALLDELLGSK